MSADPVENIGDGLFHALLLAAVLIFLRGLWLNFRPAETFPQRLCNLGLVLALLLLLPAGAGIFVQMTDLDQAVVMRNEVLLKVSPFDKAEAVGELRAGETVRPLKEFQQYILVQNQSGRRGWVGKNEIESLLPSS